jgi:hypothetical protein
MSSESVWQVARSWLDVGSFHTRLVVRFMHFTASVRNILDTPSYKTVPVTMERRFSLIYSPMYIDSVTQFHVMLL